MTSSQQSKIPQGERRKLVTGETPPLSAASSIGMKTASFRKNFLHHTIPASQTQAVRPPRSAIRRETLDRPPPPRVY